MRIQRGFYSAAPAIMLGAYALLTTLYIWLRSLGAHTVAAGNGETLERVFFRTTPTRDLQDAFQVRAPWLDFAGFLLHVSWFWLPIVYCVALLIFERKRLMEFMAWVLAGSFIAAIAFIFLPLRPPWMEAGISRILIERAFINYTDIDNNPFATLPSMHAALPVIMGILPAALQAAALARLARPGVRARHRLHAGLSRRTLAGCSFKPSISRDSPITHYSTCFSEPVRGGINL